MCNYLSSVVGQERVIDALKKFIESKQIPHAILFTGTRNVGQHFVAKQFLKELLSTKVNEKDFVGHIDKLEEPVIKYVIPLPRGKSEKPDDLPLDKLSSSELDSLKDEINKKIYNHFYEINVENANSIKISSIREIIKNLTINYADLPFRLILIEDAHLMGVESQNALLKSLEEPPDGVVFILITDSQNLLLPTIKSRCWEVPFSPLSDSDIGTILINHFNIDDTLAQKLIPFAEGSIHKVFDLLNYGFDQLLDTSVDILRHAIGRKYNTAIKLFNSNIEKNPRILIQIVIQLMINWLNDAQKIKIGIDEINCVAHKNSLENFNLKFGNVRLDNLIFELTHLSKNIDFNINLNLLMLNIIFSLSAIAKR